MKINNSISNKILVFFIFLNITQFFPSEKNPEQKKNEDIEDVSVIQEHENAKNKDKTEGEEAGGSNESAHALTILSLNATEQKVYNSLMDYYRAYITIVIEDIRDELPLAVKNTNELREYCKKNFSIIQSLMDSVDFESLTLHKMEKDFYFIINLLHLYEKTIKNKYSAIENINFSEKNILKLFQSMIMALEKYFYLINENNPVGNEDEAVKELLFGTGKIITMMLTLYNGVFNNLKSGVGYFKLGFLREQFFDKKKILLDNPNHYQRKYQNGILIDLVIKKIEKLQELFQLLTEMQSEQLISKKNFMIVYKEFIYKTLVDVVCFIEFLVETDFQYWGSEREIGNIEKIKNMILVQVNKKIKKMNTACEKKYLINFDLIDFDSKVRQLHNLITGFSGVIIDLNKREEGCRLYPIQKGYKYIYNLFGKFNKNGYFPQLINYLYGSSRNLFVIGLGLDAMYFLEKGSSIICEPLYMIGKELLDLFNSASRTVPHNEESTLKISYHDSIQFFESDYIMRYRSLDGNLKGDYSSFCTKGGKLWYAFNGKIKEDGLYSKGTAGYGIHMLQYAKELREGSPILVSNASIMRIYEKFLWEDYRYVQDVLHLQNENISAGDKLQSIDDLCDEFEKHQFSLPELSNALLNSLDVKKKYSMSELKGVYSDYKNRYKDEHLTEEQFYKMYKRREKFIEKTREFTSELERTYKGLRNESFTGLGDKLYILPYHLGSIAGGVAVSFGIHKALSYANSFEFINIIKNFFERLHFKFLGESSASANVGGTEGGIDANGGSETRVVNPVLPEEMEKVNLEGVSWEHIPNETRSWLLNIKKMIECQITGEPVPNWLQNIPKSAYLIGPSGSGKSYMIDCWAKDIANLKIKHKVDNFNVTVVYIDPKHFDKDFHVSAGEKQYIDLFEEIGSFAKENRSKNEILIIVIDEAHLMFANKDTQSIDTARLAAGFKFFSELNVMQKNQTGIGGVYVILATNRPSLIPHEFLANGGRIGEVIYIPPLKPLDCVSILKSVLRKNACGIENIDFAYLQDLFHDYPSLNYGKIEKLTHKAVLMSFLKNVVVDTIILEEAFDDCIRGIVRYKNRECYTEELKGTLLKHFSAVASLVYFFNEEDTASIFNGVTILPIIQNPHPEAMEKLYLPSRERTYVYGGVFSTTYDELNVISEKSICREILSKASGAIYLKRNHKMVLARERDLGDLFSHIYSYFANSPYHCTAAKKCQLSEESLFMNTLVSAGNFHDMFGEESEIINKIQRMLKDIEEILYVYFSNPAVQVFIDYISKKLEVKFTLHKRDIIPNEKDEEGKKIVEAAQEVYNVAIKEIKEVIHKYCV